MFEYNLDYDEGVILENEDVIWASRSNLNLDTFALTNKKLYCIYRKSNGIFKKPAKECGVLPLSDIKIINGQAMVRHTKHNGSWCLQIQFMQGPELFAFSNFPKRVIPQWISAISNALGVAAAPSPQPARKSDAYSGVFAGAFSEVADNFREVANNFRDAIDTASEAFGIPTTQESIFPSPNTATDTSAVKTPADRQAAQNSMPGYKFCVQCGAKLTPDSKFCSHCGCKVAGGGNAASPISEPEAVVPSDSQQPAAPDKVEVQAKIQNTQRQQEYVGKVFKCPNCGGVVNQSDTVCSTCGYHLSGKKAVSSAIDFQQQIMQVEMARQDRRISFWDRREALDATDKKIIALIKSYPIPNSIDDVVEFFHLAIGNIDVAKSKKSIFNSDDWDGGSRERAISNAWVGKLQQIYKKAELFFPHEPEFAHMKEAYLAVMKELKL